MGIITESYRRQFLVRFDKDAAIPYYSAEDFPGLVCEPGSYTGRYGSDVRYFIYYYPGCVSDRTILFCPGMGPGHTAYLSEIETVCRAGYRVLTLDYTGCGESGGERMPSVNAPTRDSAGLLEHLSPEGEIIPVGHSLGGYTALNLARILPGVTRAVVISGFLSISDEMIGFVKLRLLADVVGRYEKRLDPEYGSGDNLKYLSSTSDRILWIHSTDDPMVNYKHNAGRVAKLANPNLRVLTVTGKRHNPQYSSEALATMNAWIGEYNRLVAAKELDTPEAKKGYFDDKPIGRMTEQDPAIFAEILSFIGG